MLTPLFEVDQEDENKRFISLTYIHGSKKIFAYMEGLVSKNNTKFADTSKMEIIEELIPLGTSKQGIVIYMKMDGSIGRANQPRSGIVNF